MKTRRLAGMVGLAGALLLAAGAGAQQSGIAPGPQVPTAAPPPLVTRPTDKGGYFPLPAPTTRIAVPPSLDAALEQIRAHRAALQRERRESAALLASGSAKDAAERLKLRVQIAELLQRLKDRSAPAAAQPSYAREAAVPLIDPLPRPSGPPADRVTLAQVQFRGKDYAAALKTIEAVDRTDLSPRDRAWLDYLKASCLRHLGKLAEAAALYREIASGKEEAFLSESAAWQMSFLRWRQEIQAQLDDLRRTP